MLDVQLIRKNFPVLGQMVYEKPLVYFDNGATTQKPKQVIETLTNLYAEQNSSVHRAVHYLSSQITERYEAARMVVKDFIHAEKMQEVIFTAGTTASINLLAFSFGEAFINPDDEILISEMEHHSNIVPWQLLAERKGAKLKVIPINEMGELRMDKLEKLLNGKTKLLALTHVSNAIGTINPVKEIIQKAHAKNIPVLLDGAQAIQHGNVDVHDLDCDFYAFSGHKVYGPNGIGVLYGKEKWLEKMPPYQGGGDMISSVSFENTTFADLPLKFEAGTANYPAAIALAEGLNYVSSIGRSDIAVYEKKLLTYATEKFERIDGLKIYGNSPDKISTISFLLEGIHPQDIGLVLDKLGIAVRSGNHCAQPLMKSFGIEGTVRASLCFYNTEEEIDLLCEGLEKIKQMFA
ncbi:MAG: cysteine desulfurase [Bacteroidales bacterium]|nr:cysteine desulfurase [Bacteroidales bacterium]